jgi:hypothetical protein
MSKWQRGSNEQSPENSSCFIEGKSEMYHALAWATWFFENEEKPFHRYLTFFSR